MWTQNSFLHFLHCRDDRQYTIYNSLEGPFDLTKQKARGAVPWTSLAIRITWISWWKCNRRPGSSVMSRLPVWFPKRIDEWISFLARCFFTRKGQGSLGDFDGNLLRYMYVYIYAYVWWLEGQIQVSFWNIITIVCVNKKIVGVCGNL